ncbi:hypothetical protein J7E88_06405 [Streptomyces sp. ISL-10]|uniref:hypothetical protein n=1 Tax=Streptomyces sp. ISL-10 TaxID=2819172 RepID=UPI001BE7EB5E|nr:hypothetical protein [Streptomyces sp. ISL-10]MBT2364963.1 hypothetical protein [Streptomyces sp. ISL-10]
MIDDLERPRVPLLRWLWITLAVVIGAPVLFVLCLVVTYGIESATPEDYPRVAPQKMADRATARSHQAYALAGFDTVLPAGVDNSLAAGSCYPGGLESMADTPVDGAYALSHTWQVSDVPRAEALAALARLRDRLKEEGWTVTSYERRQASQDWILRTERGDGERQVYEWMSVGGRFFGGVHMECAYDPAADADAGSSGGSYGETYGGSSAADGLVAPALGAGA